MHLDFTYIDPEHDGTTGSSQVLNPLAFIGQHNHC